MATSSKCNYANAGGPKNNLRRSPLIVKTTTAYRHNAQINIQNMILPRVRYFFVSFCWALMYFSSAERCCVSFFAASVQTFSFASVTAFPSCQRDLVAIATEMHVDWIITLVVSCYFGSLALREVTFIWIDFFYR